MSTKEWTSARRLRSKMNYTKIIKKLKKGVALAEKHKKIAEKKVFNSPIAKIAFKSAVSTKQMHDLGDFNEFGEGIVEKLKNGSFFPDQVYGWSTKSVLALLLVMLLLKLKSITKGQ